MTAIPRYFANNAGAAGGATTASVVLPLTTTGDVILVATFTTGAQTITGVADGTNTYTRVGGMTHAIGTMELWATLNVTGSATPVTVTATWSGTAPFNSLWASNVSYMVTSGLLDASNTLTGIAVQNMNGASVTSTATQELQVTLFLGSGKPMTSGASAVGWITGTSTAMHNNGFGVGLLPGATSLTNSTNWFQTSSAVYISYIAALKVLAATSFGGPLQPWNTTAFGGTQPFIKSLANYRTLLPAFNNLTVVGGARPWGITAPFTFQTFRLYPLLPQTAFGGTRPFIMLPRTFIATPQVVPAIGGRFDRIPHPINCAITPAMPYPATIGQTWPPPFGGQYPSS